MTAPPGGGGKTGGALAEGVKYGEAGNQAENLGRRAEVMNRKVIISGLEADGVLQSNIPIEAAAVNGQVHVTIGAAGPKHPTITEQEEWRQFISSTASAWQVDLKRPEHGEYE
jgi:hypothetical protein